METTFLASLITLDLETTSTAPNQSLQSSAMTWNQPIFQSILIAGPRHSGKTSFMFELAFQFACQRIPVIFIAPRKIDTLPMFVGDRKLPAPSVLKIIDMVYPQSTGDLLSFVSSLHLTKISNTGLVVVDNIDHYFGNGDKTAVAEEIAKVCAYIIDAVSFINKIRDSFDTKCVLVTTVSTEDEVCFLQQKQLLERWFPTILKIQETNCKVTETTVPPKYQIINDKHIKKKEGSLEALLFTCKVANKIDYTFHDGKVLLQQIDSY